MKLLLARCRVAIFVGAVGLLHNVCCIDAFVVDPCPNKRHYTRKVAPPTTTTTGTGRHAFKNSDQLFASAGWKTIAADLNQCPVFCCASAEGHPLAYEIQLGNNRNNTFNVPCFYVDADDAQVELKKCVENLELAGIGLIPFALGQAFELWSKDQAVIVPSKPAILQAGAPPDTNPIGQQVPLFACMTILQEKADGTAVLPLFMDRNDANAAVEQAIQMDGGTTDDFEITSLSLDSAIELLATVPDTPAVQFMAPQKSIDFIQQTLLLSE